MNFPVHINTFDSRRSVSHGGYACYGMLLFNALFPIILCYRWHDCGHIANRMPRTPMGCRSPRRTPAPGSPPWSLSSVSGHRTRRGHQFGRLAHQERHSSSSVAPLATWSSRQWRRRRNHSEWLPPSHPSRLSSPCVNTANIVLVKSSRSVKVLWSGNQTLEEK